MTATQTVSTGSLTRRRTILAIAVGIVIAIIGCTIVAYAAYAAGANASFAPLRPAIYAPFVAVGVIAAYLGWSIIRRRAAHPARLLRVLVPSVLVVSFVPDVLLQITGFIPGTSLTAVIALAIMHVIVAAVAVPLCMRLAPVR